MKSTILGLLAVGLLAGPMAANAAPITVSAGESYTFNFDFGASGAVPAPPYSLVRFTTGLDVVSFGAGDTGTWDLFSDLNASGSIFDSPFLTTVFTQFSSVGWSDGIFSARLTMTGGSVTVDPFAFGRSATGALTQNVYPTSVPEPGTLALLGLGLAGLGLGRRRRA